MGDGSEPIDPAETLYRRIPSVWAGHPFPSPLAFTPRSDDVDGLSVYRAKYTSSIEEIAHNDRGASYYVAAMRAGELLDAGIEIAPSPDLKNNKPGHAHLPGITCKNRKEPEAVNRILMLATRLSKVHGPFPANI